MKDTSVIVCMERYAAQYHVPIISSDGATRLVETVKKKQPLSVLEIGTAIGYSTLLIACHLPPQAKIITIEQDPERAAIAQQYLKQAGKMDQVTILIGDAAELIPQMKSVFDFVFIDAAKGQYLDYLKKVMSKLLKHAVIIADNIFFRGLVEGAVDPPRRYKTIVKRLRQYIDYVTTSEQFATSLYHEGDGIAISIYQEEHKQ